MNFGVTSAVGQRRCRYRYGYTPPREEYQVYAGGFSEVHGDAIALPVTRGGVSPRIIQTYPKKVRRRK